MRHPLPTVWRTLDLHWPTIVPIFEEFDPPAHVLDAVAIAHRRDEGPGQRLGSERCGAGALGAGDQATNLVAEGLTIPGRGYAGAAFRARPNARANAR